MLEYCALRNGVDIDLVSPGAISADLVNTETPLIDYGRSQLAAGGYNRPQSNTIGYNRSQWTAIDQILPKSIIIGHNQRQPITIDNTRPKSTAIALNRPPSDAVSPAIHRNGPESIALDRNLPTIDRNQSQFCHIDQKSIPIGHYLPQYAATYRNQSQLAAAGRNRPQQTRIAVGRSQPQSIPIDHNRQQLATSDHRWPQLVAIAQK